MRWPLLGDMPDLYRDVLATFARLKRRSGVRAEFRLATERALLLSDPDDACRLLLAPEEKVRKSRYTRMMGVVFGESVLIAEGDAWKRQRDYLNPLFSRKAVSSHIPAILEETARMTNSLKAAPGAQFEAGKESRRLIQRIMGRILFGDLFPQTRVDELMVDLQTVNDCLFGDFIRKSVLRGPLALIPTPGAGKLKWAVASIGAFIDDLIMGDPPEDHPSLAAAIIRAAPAGERRAQEIKDQITVLFYAGQDTTARVLTWTLYFLSENPGWIDVVRGEAIAANADDPSQVDFKSMPMTWNIIREAMRMRPVAYAIDRQLMDDSVLDCESVKAGTIAPIAVSNIHHDERHWPNPDQFDPLRFTQESSQGRHPCAYIPFGHGRRKCLGAGLAEIELILVVANFCSAFDFQKTDETPIRAKAAVTLAPEPEVKLILTPVSS